MYDGKFEDIIGHVGCDADLHLLWFVYCYDSWFYIGGPDKFEWGSGDSIVVEAERGGTPFR